MRQKSSQGNQQQNQRKAKIHIHRLTVYSALSSQQQNAKKKCQKTPKN